MSDEFVFDLAKFMEEAAAETQNKAHGSFQQIVVEPGCWAYVAGLGYHEQFFSAVKHAGMDKAELAAKKAGSSNPRHTFKLTKLANTSITEYQSEKDRISYVFPGTWEWKLWQDNALGGEHPLTNSMFGKPVFAHVAGARHPEFDAENPATHTEDTVWWDHNNNEPKLDDEGRVRAQYYDYPKAVFETEDELRNYAIANGVDVEAGAPSFDFPVPQGWLDNQLTEGDWKESLPALVAEIQGNKKPRALVLKELAKSWESAGVTASELEHIYDTVVTANGLEQPPF